MARNIEAFKLRTELTTDNAKFSAGMKASEKDVDKLGQRFTKLGPEIDKAMKGHELGAKFGQSFSASATTLITGSFDSLGQTLGSLLGTAIAPGLGTAIGSTVGSGVDLALSKISGPLQATIARGVQLNKVLDSTKVEFTSFTGSAEEADKYLNKLLVTSSKTGIMPRMLIETSESLQDFTQDLKLTDLLLRASIEKSADIGGGPEKLRAVADALGLLAEKGDLSSTSLRKLYALKINAPKALAEGFGISEEEVNRLISEGRIRGEVAATIIADKILREQTGFAEKLARTTTEGGENLFSARSEILAARGTETATRKYGQFARAAADAIGGPRAEQYAGYVDQGAASLFGLVEKGLPAGIQLVQGIGTGLTSDKATQSLYSALEKLRGAVGLGLSTVLEIKSPSEFTARVAGVPMGEGIAVGLERGFVSFFQTKTGPALRDKIEEWVSQAAKDFNVPEELIRAVMQQESSGNPRAVSSKDARGLMQLMGPTARRFGVKDRFDPQQSIRGGTQYLRFLLDHFGGNIPLTLAGYNAGEGAVDKYGGIPPYPETQDYVRRIMGRMGKTPTSASLPQAQTGADWSDVSAMKRVMDSLTPEERGEIERLGQTIKETMKALAETGAQLSDAKSELQRSQPGQGGPGWQAHYDVNREARASVLVDSLQSRQDKLRESLSQLNLENQQLIQSTISLHLAEDDAAKRMAAEREAAYKASLVPSVPTAREIGDVFDHLADVTLPELPKAANDAALALDFTKGAFGDFGLGLPPLMQGMKATGESIAELTKLDKAYQASMRKTIGAGVDMLGRLSGAIGQIAGLMPQQEVGKKRGFWSKALGIAAPFLNFIPGVGPILSQIAGIASAGIGGNWSGVVTGIAGGLAPGGAFRPKPTATTTGGKRARGGPGVRGQMYWTGEEGPEPFLAPADGRFLSHGDAMQAMSGGGDSTGLNAVLAQHLSSLDRLSGILARLESMKPHDVVRVGARGMIDAYDQDAGLIRLSGQRHRFA